MIRVNYSLFKHIEFSTIYKFNFNEPTDLLNLENQLTKNKYLKDEILSVDDIIIFEKLKESSVIINTNQYPNIFKWANELERMRRNWKLSKRKDKGSSFAEFIKLSEDKIRNEKKDNKENVNISKEIPIEHNKIKKLKEYSVSINIRFDLEQENNWLNISNILNQICQIYLPRGSIVKPIKDEKTGEIFAVIETMSHKKDFDFSSIKRDIQNEIPTFKSIDIIEVKEISN